MGFRTMEQESGKIMSKILGKRDLDKVPVDILAKVEKFYDQRFEEFLTTKALYDIAQRNVGKYFVFCCFVIERCFPFDA